MILGILRLLCWRDLILSFARFVEMEACSLTSLAFLRQSSTLLAPLVFLLQESSGVSAKENFEWGVPSQDFLRFVIENLCVAGQFTHLIYAMFSRNKVE